MWNIGVNEFKQDRFQDSDLISSALTTDNKYWKCNKKGKFLLCPLGDKCLVLQRVYIVGKAYNWESLNEMVSANRENLGKT